MGQHTSPTLDPGSWVPPDGTRASPQAGPPVAKSTPLHPKTVDAAAKKSFPQLPYLHLCWWWGPHFSLLPQGPPSYPLGTAASVQHFGGGRDMSEGWGKDGARSNDT